jgi:uncharacterized protein (TIGR03437 family)
MGNGKIFSALLAFILSSAAGLAQNLQFNLLPAGDNSPSARFDSAITYDPVSNQVFAFGGSGSQTQNDLWAYSIPAGKWAAVAATGTKPPARFGHTLILDPVRRRLILFGGQAGTFYSDVWAFDLAGQAWNQLAADQLGPNSRYGHSAIYDPVRDRMVISHGFTSAGRFDDTWTFSFANNRWTDISPAGNRPLRRCLHHAAYDGKRDQMFLYGGCSSGYGPCPQDDLWGFDLKSGQWNLIAVLPKPPGRERYGMVFDSVRDRLVLFGGSGTSGLLNDTWEYDPGARTWNQVTVNGLAPAARDRHESVFAANLGAMIFFAGQTNSGLTNELWMLSSPAPGTAITGVINALSGAPGPFAPGEIVSVFGSGLGPATGIATSFDATTGLLPVSSSGTSAVVGGIAAPLYYVSRDQINLQIPYELSGSTSAELRMNGSVSTTVGMTATHAGLLPQIFNEDGALNSPQNPAVQGSVVVLYATGQGVTNPASVTGAIALKPSPAAALVSVEIGGLMAEVLFQGTVVGTSGILQVNARLPEGLPATATVSLVVGGQRSQSGVTVQVQQLRGYVME